jgi:hypothetical protein
MMLGLEPDIRGEGDIDVGCKISMRKMRFMGAV